jgi:hypothetical protein
MALLRKECVAPHGLVVWGWMLFLTSLLSPDAKAEPSATPQQAPNFHQSPHFAVRTDLPDDRVEQAMERLEATLDFAVTCWGRPAKGRIDCFLIDDVSNWRDANLPHPLARVLVEGIGGVTLGYQDFGGADGGQRQRQKQLAMGRMSRQTRKTLQYSRADKHHAIIYASTDPGVVEHEIMHAYCLQVFGATGPDWYKEGMAEMASFGERDQEGVKCPNDRLAALRNKGTRSVKEVMEMGEAGLQLQNSLESMMAKRRDPQRQVPLTDWTRRDAEMVEQTREDYLWTWALCHLLYHNPTYRDRFRLLGTAYFAQRHNAFAEIFGSMHGELDFEYSQFIRHVEVGYRADLCRWEWNYQPRMLESGQILSAEVRAAGGWQSADVQVKAGNVYAYRADGTWSTGGDRPETNARGDQEGRGRLVGVLFHDYQLTEVFPLGPRGSFVAPRSGQLYLRCQDEWGELSDNLGSLHFRIMRQGSTRK